MTSSDTTEGVVNVATLTFTPQNWNMPQMLIVTGVDDTVADGNIVFSIVLAAATSTDPNLSVTEQGGTATFRVALTLAPTANVTCTLQSSDLTEGTVSPTTLTFTPNNFGLQTVTVTGDAACIVTPAVPLAELPAALTA